MNVILLSGGSGKRLWPLSNDIRAKQFIKIFKGPGGAYESMVQRVYRQIKAVDPGASITIATSKAQVSAIRNHLGGRIQVSLEPCRRDTFPAIALAAAYLHDVMGLPEEEPAVVCPVDPYVDDSYFEAFRALEELAARGEANLILMGIEPTYPSEKYGYIIPETKEAVSRVLMFREKPDEETAKGYLAQGALWNGGVFAFKLKYVLDVARQLLGYTDYWDLFSRYDTLGRTSFDYAVVEKEKRIQVLRYGGEWRDLGTWNTLAEAMDSPAVGPAILNETCENVHVVNELDIPVLVMGLKNAIISASPEGILVSEKHASAHIKPYVENLNNRQARFAEKSWGLFKVLDANENGMTIRLDVMAGYRFIYHSHEHRDESWTVVAGEGTAVIDGKKIPVKPGSTLFMPASCKHTLAAHTAMTLIEVQIGPDITLEDKRRFDDEAWD